ncbi:HSPB1-associated protein 1-like isoform X2 [Argiope bruennichi]|nr:HSPB1-associated protein 1-like isoform X2 [Argiope bruennichi]
MLGHSERDFPVPSELREAIKNHLDIPVVFKNQIKSWSTPLLNSNLTGKYGNTVLDFRIVPKSYKGVSWEAQHTFEEATISDFISWQNEENVALDSTNPFKKYKKNEYWAYSSYNYMNVIFPNDSDIQTMKWDAFGFPEVTGKESTFWLGSEGANTPCHFDSYGCNLVAQITGRKQWILFPATDTSFLYPTRIPYEESSVFSSVNILNVDFTCHPLFKNAHPHIITLEPGDVLFVPKKWWHFVSCLDNITISINTWIELDSDPHCRLEEGVARALMSALITFYEPDKENWLNPKEELVSPNEAIKYITTSLQEIGGITDKDQDKNPQFSKVCKTAGKFDVHNSICKDSSIHDICDYKYIEKVEPSSFQEYLIKTNQQLSLESVLPQEITLKKIINSFVHPEVVSLICHLLKDK